MFFSTKYTSILSEIALDGHPFIIHEIPGISGEVPGPLFAEDTEEALREDLADFKPLAIDL